MGSFIAPLIIGPLYEKYGWHIGFGLGGIGMLIALLIFRFYAVPQMRRYNKETGIAASWEQPTVKRKNVGKWITLIMVLLAAIVILIATDIVPFNATIVAKSFAYIIATFVSLYFIYMFFLTGLNKNERMRLLVCLILLISATFFWSAFEQNRPHSTFLLVIILIAILLMALKFQPYGFKQLIRCSSSFLPSIQLVMANYG